MNYSFTQPKFTEGQTISNCNLTQASPGTEIGKGVKGLKFIDCNLVNCKLPKDAQLIGCNNTQVSRCTHVHPEMIKRGVPACGEDCAHRKSGVKAWVKVEEGEKEYIALKKAQLQPNATPVRVSKTVDEFGITRQVFEKEVYVYEDTIT